MRDDRTDVVVVGGGPAGSVAAFQLASTGTSVTLIDRAVFPREKVCGESLSPGALARLGAIGMWQPTTSTTAASPHSNPVRGMRIRSPRGTTFFGRYKNGQASPGLAIRRTILDRELLDRARSRGVRVVEGIEAIGAETTPAGAIVLARPTGGTAPLRFEAKRVVIADGRGSFLARKLGFLEPDGRQAGPRRFAVRAHCIGVTALSDLAEMHVGEGGYCGLSPLSEREANICYVLFRDRIDITPRTIAADFQRHVSAFPEIAERIARAEVQGRIRVIGPLRLRSRSQSSGPFIACGDTTGFLDPFTGEGIAHAIACGVLGAEAVLASLAGSSSAFGEYERRIRDLRRVKGIAALLLFGLVSRRSLANSAASLFASMPRLGDAVVQLFGDQV